MLPRKAFKLVVGLNADVINPPSPQEPRLNPHRPSFNFTTRILFTLLAYERLAGLIIYLIALMVSPLTSTIVVSPCGLY